MDWAEAGVAESAQHITEPVRADPKDHQGGPVGGGGPAATASRPGGCGRARPGPPPAPHGRAGGPEPRAPPGGASERWSLWGRNRAGLGAVLAPSETRVWGFLTRFEVVTSSERGECRPAVTRGSTAVYSVFAAHHVLCCAEDLQSLLWRGMRLLLRTLSTKSISSWSNPPCSLGISAPLLVAPQYKQQNGALWPDFASTAKMLPARSSNTCREPKAFPLDK